MNVLLIEDNANDAEFFEHHLLKLRDRSASLETRKSLAAGLLHLSQGSTDIVFLDLTLPDSAGLNTLITTHSQAPAIPIIVLTGRDDDDLALHALSIGAQDYLVKGHIDPQALGRAINYAIERQHSAHMSEWLASIVESSNDAIYAETMDGIIRSWNHGAEQIYGYPASEALGKTIDIILPPGSQDGSFIRQTIKGGAPIENFETTRRRKDGTDVVVSVSAAAIKNAEGEATGISLTARDMTSQRLAAEALIKSNQRLKLAVQAAKIGIWQWDTAAGTARCDDRTLEQFGLSRLRSSEETDHAGYDLTIEQVISCIHPDDREVLKHQITKVTEDKSDYDCEYRVVWPDGSIHDLEVRGELSPDHNGNPLQMTGVSLDVTERKRTARELQENEHRLRLVVESAEMGIWDLDLASGNLWRSLKHDQIFGYDQLQPDWTFERVLSQVIPEDRDLLRKSFDKVLIGDVLNLEFRIINVSDNAIHWLAAQGEAHRDAHGKATRVVGVVADITERKSEEQRTLKALADREHLAHSIVQHAPVGIVTLNASLSVTDINAAFAAMIYRDREDLLGKPLAHILPDETFQTAGAAIQKNEPLQLARQKVTIVRNGTQWPRYWNMAFWPLAQEEGAVLQITDCTDTVILEQQREDFVAAIAHDIKNPLIGAERVFGILCNESKAVAPETQANMLSVLKDSNHNLLDLVQNLVDIYRFETLTFPVHYQAIDLKTLVAGCCEQVASFAETREVDLKIDAPDSLPFLQADEVGIRRVLMNLLHNSIKFNKEAGTTSVVIRQLGEVLEIDVRDQGVGIDEVDQGRLFQRFSQGKAGSCYSGGTGLGLYLCKQIIVAHHGSISCKSSASCGSVFSVLIPLVPPSAAIKP